MQRICRLGLEIFYLVLYKMPQNSFFKTTNEAYNAIRVEAWLQNNPNISEWIVRRYQKRAFSELLTTIVSIYDINTFEDSKLQGSIWEQVLQDIETILGAGYLLYKEYNTNAFGGVNEDEGFDKISEAKSMMKDVSSGRIKLFDNTNTEFTRVSWIQSGWPVASKANSDRRFYVEDKY